VESPPSDSMFMPDEPNPVPIFSGEFRHTLDSKNRLTVTAAWRRGEADEFYLALGRDGTSVRAMPPEKFRSIAAMAQARTDVSRPEIEAFLLDFYSGSHRVVLDKQRRLVVPEDFCDRAGLRGEIVLLGALDYFQIWSREAWLATKVNRGPAVNRIKDMFGL
jgi:MraZ protein